MDHSFSNTYLNFGDFSNTQNNDNSLFFSNSSQYPVNGLPQKQSQFSVNEIHQKQSRTTKWEVEEDVALMSAWCMVSEDPTCGKNQKKSSMWSSIKKIYDAAQAENPEKLGERNESQMKGRFKRLNESVQKWVSAYREAYRQRRSGMSHVDIESEAHKLYEQQCGHKFTDLVVFNQVMCKHQKWDLQLHHDTTRLSREFDEGNEESGSSTKRSRTADEGDYSNPETPNSVPSTVQRPIGRDGDKKKRGKAKVNEFVEELRALRLTRETEVEVMKKKIEIEQQKEKKKDEREQKRAERELKNMQLMHLNTLLQRADLSPEEENLKRLLISKYY